MHPLDGPRAKVKRVKSQLVAYNATCERFFERYPYSIIVAEFNKKAGCYSLRIKDCPPPFPIEWSVIIGEIAHDLRSALDGLVWQIALLNPNITKPSGNTAFPIYRLRYVNINGSNYLRFWHEDYGLRLLKSVCGCFRTRIEAFQPYKRGNGGRHSPLFLLNKLNNSDKHRLITVFVAEDKGYEFTGLIGGGSKFKVGMPLYANAKVGCVNPLPDGGVPTLGFKDGKPTIVMQDEVQVNLVITPDIRFGNSCNAVKHLPVSRTLSRISDEVSSVIESFAKDF